MSPHREPPFRPRPSPLPPPPPPVSRDVIDVAHTLAFLIPIIVLTFAVVLVIVYVIQRWSP